MNPPSFIGLSESDLDDHSTVWRIDQFAAGRFARAYEFPSYVRNL
jgi:hypothetical protein